MLPSLLHFPARYFVTSGEARFFHMRVAMTRSSLFTTFELLGAYCVAYATIVMLLLHTPTCAHFSGTHASSTSQPRTLTAISKSELVMSPVGFCGVTNLPLTLGGHWSLQTIRARAFVPDSQTPPVLSPDASRVPLYVALPETSCLTWVGSLVASGNSCFQSCSLCVEAHIPKHGAGVHRNEPIYGPKQ